MCIMVPLSDAALSLLYWVTFQFKRFHKRKVVLLKYPANANIIRGAVKSHCNYPAQHATYDSERKMKEHNAQ